jgi:hypothetical protein
MLKSLPECILHVLCRWLKATREAMAELPQDLEVTQWKGSLFEDEPYVDNYREFRKLRGAAVPPFEAPETLPGLPKGLDPGQLPTAEELRQNLAEADSAVLHPEVPLRQPAAMFIMMECSQNTCQTCSNLL